MRPTMRSWPGEWAFVLGPAVVDALPVREERKRFIRRNRKRQTGGNPLVEQANKLREEASKNPGSTVLYGESAVDGHVFDAKDEVKKEDDHDPNDPDHDHDEDEESSLSSDDDPDGVSSLDEDEVEDPSKPRIADGDKKNSTIAKPPLATPVIPGTIPDSALPDTSKGPQAFETKRINGMSEEVNHFLIAFGTIAGLAVVGAIIWFILRRKPELRQRLVTKLFPARYSKDRDPPILSEKPLPPPQSNRFLRRITMRTTTSDQSSTLFGRSRGAPTTTIPASYRPAALADDDNITERRYSRQNLVRASLLRRMPVSSSSPYTSTPAMPTPPPIYSSPTSSSQNLIPEKQPYAVSEAYVPNGFTYGSRPPSQASNSSSPKGLSPGQNSRFSTSTRTTTSTRSEAPRFRGVNSWVSNQASRLVGGTVMPLPPTPVAGRYSRGTRESAMSETPTVWREHPGERMSYGEQRGRVLSGMSEGERRGRVLSGMSEVGRGRV